jgi:hypothetical protein
LIAHSKMQRALIRRTRQPRKALLAKLAMYVVRFGLGGGILLRKAS